jgi:hypothetical protein
MLLGVFIGGIVFVGLSLYPPVQGWLLRRLIATQPGWKIDFQRIGAGPTGFDASGLKFTMPGVAATSAPIAVRIAPTRLLSKRELRLERVEAQKIRVVLTPAELAPTPAGERPPAPFEGVLRLLQAPLPWALDTAKLDGEIIVRDAGQSRLTGTFNLRGGGLSPATPGEFAYELSANSLILSPGPNHQFTSAGTVQVTQDANHGIASVVIQGDLHLPRYGNLILPPGHLTMEVTATPAGEKYTAHLQLAEAVRLDLDASLDARRSKLTGHVVMHADQTAAVSLLGDKTPRAVVEGGLTFAFDFRSGDLDASVSGNLAAGDWQKIMPHLAALDDFHVQLAAAIQRRGDALILNSLDAILHGNKSAAVATVSIKNPVDLRKLPASSLAEVSLVHWPLAWANPFLKDSGTQLANDGEFSAAWSVASNGPGEITLSPTQPAILAPVRVVGDNFFPFPSLTIAANPTIEASTERIKLTMENFNVVSSRGDRLDSQLEISREFATGELHSHGHLGGALPTLFVTEHGSPPATLNAGWDFALTDTQLHLNKLSFDLRNDKSAPPAVSIDLVQAFAFDLKKHLVAPAKPKSSLTETSDLLRLRFDHLPMRWLSSTQTGPLAGTLLTSGESTFQSSPTGEFILHTQKPWRFESILVAPGIPLSIEVSPGLSLHGDDLTAVTNELSITDANGNRAVGRIDTEVKIPAAHFNIAVTLDADLPELPHSAGNFGPLRGSLRAKFHDLTPRIAAADVFDFHLHNAAGELVSVTAPAPFLFGLSNNSTVVVSTLAPIQLKTAAFPLAWLKPWTGSREFTGNVTAMAFTLSARNDAYFVRAAKRVTIDHFTLSENGRPLVRDASVAFEPGLDLTFICATKPKLDLAYTGMAHVTEATVDVGERHALDLDLALAFKGNDKALIPDGIDLTGRMDFAALSSGGVNGVPARGTLVTRVNGSLLGDEPVELWSRLTGVPGGKPGQSLPPFEIALKGEFSRENILTGGVNLLLATQPTPTDAHFAISFNLLAGALDITSGLHSKFIDCATLLELARAFPPTTAPAKSAMRVTTAPSSEAKSSSASDATLPFWGELTGSFDLDIGALEFDPYRIDRVRGRLDATRNKLNLHDLGGEMFAGRWGGNVAIEHLANNTTGEHTLGGEFHIEQFESARVVQTVFPHQLATIDARIDVNAKVASHGNSLVSLVDQSTADFSVDGANGILRLTVPKADLVSTAAVFGGTLLLSPELRALGRLLKKFAEMPVERLAISGRRATGGEVTIDEFRFDSPQARLSGHGHILADGREPLMNHPLELSLSLQAKDELAIILGGMSLLDKKPQPDGFRTMRDPFVIGGRAGTPDTTPLYDLFAKGVSGSKGTWGFLMRKLEAEVTRGKPAATSHSP